MDGLAWRTKRGECVGCWAGLSLLMALVTGCASPGPPRAPSLHLPQPVKELSAERRGDVVVLRFATPQRTTLDEPVMEAVTATLCRSVGTGPCVATASYPGKVAIAGEVEWTDALPAGLASGPSRAVAYRIEVFNVAGRSAGPSSAAWVMAGEAPKAVEGLSVTGSRDGVVLRWAPDPTGSGEVLVRRVAVEVRAAVKAEAARQPEMAAEKKAQQRKKKRVGQSGASVAGVTPVERDGSVWLHAAMSGGGGAVDNGGMVDATASADVAYRYTAVRSRTVMLDGRSLELRSVTSAPATVTLHDVFPPAAPKGLLAAAFPLPQGDGVAVDLVWQPNGERDLAGYNVYRQALGADGAVTGSMVKLSATPVQTLVFHDVGVVRGRGYRYTVTAVDAKGNESAASVAADVTP